MDTPKIHFKVSIFVALLFIFGSVGAQEADPLDELAEQMAGRWVLDSWVEDHPGEVTPGTGDAWIMVEIDPNLREGNQLKVKVSTYCLPGSVDYLHFERRGNKLVYAGASYQGCFFDINRIDDLTLEMIEETDRSILLYEGQETEYENSVSARLVRVSGM